MSHPELLAFAATVRDGFLLRDAVTGLTGRQVRLIRDSDPDDVAAAMHGANHAKEQR